MFSPTSIAKTSSDNHKRKYKDAWRKLLDIKQDIYNTKLRRFIQCIFILLIIVIIIYILLCYKHIITGATFNSSSPLHQDINTNDANINNNNITMDKKEKIIIPNNSNNVSSIDKILVDSNSTNDKDKEQEEDIESNDNNNDNDIVNGINPKNISQPDIQKFIDNWGKEKEPAKDDKTSKKNNKSLLLKNHTLHQNMWSRSNLSDKPRLSLSSSQLNDISISSLVWDFGSCGCTGWGIETVNIIKPLSERIDNIKLITDYDCWCPGYSEETQDLMNRLQSRQDYLSWSPIQIFISHKPPSRYPRFPYHGIIDIEERPEIIIGRSMIEVDYITKEDLDRMKSSEWIDELWVPSRFVKIIYVQNGIHPNKIRIIPEPLNIDIYNEDIKPYKQLPSKNRKKGLIKVTKKTFKFLSVFKWEPRKGVDILLKAFIKEFKKKDNVQLYLQTYAYEQSDELSRDFNNLQSKLNATIDKIIENDDELDRDYIYNNIYPKIEIMTKQRSMKQLASLYATANCYISASHGEGFGLPVMEAMAVGTPVIVTKWSGLRDLVVNNSYGYLIDIDGKEYAENTIGRTDFVEDKQKWAQINIDSLMENMRNVYQNRKRAKRIGRNGQKYVYEHFHPDIITNKIEKRLKELIYIKTHNDNN